MIERFIIHFHLLQLIFQEIVIATKRKIGNCFVKTAWVQDFFQLYYDVEDQTLENSSIKKINVYIISQFEMLVIGRTIIKFWSLYP